MLYNRPGLKSRIFMGSEPIEAPGVKATVSYELEAPPIVKLSAPSADQWKRAIKADGNPAQPAQNAMIVTMPKLHLTRPDEAGHMQQGVVSLDAIVTVSIVNNVLAYNALAVIIDLSTAKPFDQMIYKKIVIPRALKAVNAAFGQPHIPNIQFRGLNFGAMFLKWARGVWWASRTLPTSRRLRRSNSPRCRANHSSSCSAARRCRSPASPAPGSLQAGRPGRTAVPVSELATRPITAACVLISIAVQVGADPTVVTALVAVSASASAGISVLDTIIGGIKTGASAVAGAATTAANAVADGAKTAANAVAQAFHSY